MRSILGGTAGRNTNRSGALLRNTQNKTGRGGGTLNYIEIFQLIERRQLNNKKGKLTDGEIKMLVKDWHDKRAEEDLNQTTVEMEMKAMEKTPAQFNVEQLGNVLIQKEDGMMRIFVCQMGGLESKEVREFKIAATEILIKKYDINVCLCMELNFNWSKVNPSSNLAS